jgi:hypothetical protein
MGDEPPTETDGTPSKKYDRLYENIDRSNVWVCQLLFPVSETPTDKESFGVVDLMSLLEPEQKKIRYYFDPEKYPPALFTEEDSGGWNQLRTDIQGAARECGYQLACNGGKDRYRSFCCARAEVYKRKHPVVPGVYKQPKMHGNKRNTRPGGLAMPRNTTTTKVQQEDAHRACTMRFCIYVDDTGFYFSFRGMKDTACREHCFHARLEKGELRPSSKHITPAARQLIGHVNEACVSNAANANIYMKRNPGEFITDSQIHIHEGAHQYVQPRPIRNCQRQGRIFCQTKGMPSWKVCIISH